MVANAIRLFLQSAGGSLEALRSGALHRDPDAIRDAAHSLKASSGIVGAARLARLCRQIEELGRERQIETVADLLDQVEPEFHLVRDALGTELST